MVYKQRKATVGELKSYNRKIAQSIDQQSRFVFPLAFLLFNALYWPYYRLS